MISTRIVTFKFPRHYRYFYSFYHWPVNIFIADKILIFDKLRKRHRLKKYRIFIIHTCHYHSNSNFLYVRISISLLDFLIKRGSLSIETSPISSFETIFPRLFSPISRHFRVSIGGKKIDPKIVSAVDGGRAKGRRARIKTRLEGPHCLVNRRETAHRLPMCANETLEGRGSLPLTLSLHR